MALFPSKLTVQIPELKEITKAVNRLGDILDIPDCGEEDQQEVDAMTASLQQANGRTRLALDRIKEAVAINESQ